MDDIPTLTEMAAKPDAVEVLVAAGMSRLAGEIEWLQFLVAEVKKPTLLEALQHAGFEAVNRDRVIVGQGRNSARRREGTDR